MHVAFAHHLLTQLEAELGMQKRIGLEVQIESARGAENLPAIADASDRIETIIFGPGDYAADLGIPQLSVGAVDDSVKVQSATWPATTSVSACEVER